MDIEVYSPAYGALSWQATPPPSPDKGFLPLALVYRAEGAYGRIQLQEVRDKRFLIRYYIFELVEQLTLFSQERSGWMQSVLALKGMIGYGLRGKNIDLLNEGQFTLLKGEEFQTEMVIDPGPPSHFLHVYYPPESYAEWKPLFPQLLRDLKKAVKRPRFFLSFPRPARAAVLDAVREIFYERYRSDLVRTNWNLKLKHALFTLCAQAYTEEAGRASTPLEKQIAFQVKGLIEKDLRVHHPNDELARLVGYSESTVKRAFQQEYSMAMYEYLRRLRMQKARALLLAGELVKNVAPAVGMRPSSFTTEFQKYFGYNPTTLRQTKQPEPPANNPEP